MRTCRRHALLLAAAALPATAHAAPVHVPDDAETIAEALTMVGEWDTVYVDAARYAGEAPVTVDFNVQIESDDGAPVDWPQFVVVDATLRLGDGTVWADVLLEGTAASGVNASEYAAVLVLDGVLEAHGLTVQGLYGYGLYGIDSDVHLDGGYVVDALYTPAIKLYNVYDDLTVSVTGTELAFNAYGALLVHNTAAARYVTVDVTRATFSGNTTYEYGADVRVVAVDALTITGGSFFGAVAVVAGGSVYAYDSNVLVEGASFGANTASHGGSIYAISETSTHTLTLQGAYFEGGTAVDVEGAGGEVATDGVDVVIDDVHAERGGAYYGGFLYAYGGTVTVRDSALWDGDAAAGGSLFLDEVRDASVLGSTLCANTASYGAAVYALASGLAIDTSVLHMNEAWTGAAVEADGGTLALVDDTFVVNPGPVGAVSILDARGEIVNSIFSGSYTGVGVAGTGSVAEAGYNLYWELDVADAGYSSLGGDVYADPRFAASFDRWTCGSEPWIAAGSPAIDAGDPGRTDTDGSRSDIGAYDGEGVVGPDTGGETGWVDPDTGGDTGETDGETGAGAPDADGDGVSDTADCAPDDPAIFPGATDDPFDDIDQDCDGDAASGSARGGCGCDGSGRGPPGGGGPPIAGTGVGAGVLVGLVGLAGAFARRRGGAGGARAAASGLAAVASGRPGTQAST